MKGTMKARAVEWGLGVSNGGKEQIVVMFKIVGGEFEGRQINWFGYFTEKTVDRTLESMRHCGWDGDDLSDLRNLDANEVELVIDEEEFVNDNGESKLTTKVKFINKPGRLALKQQMTPSQAQAFAARMRGKTVASKQKYGAQPARAGHGDARGGSHDRDDVNAFPDDFYI